MKDANPQDGLDQLINLSEQQSQHRLNSGPARTPQPPATAAVPQPAAPVSGPQPAVPSATSQAVCGTEAGIQEQSGTRWAGPVILVVALGVFGQAWIGYEARTSGNFSANLWYITLCLIFVPSAALVMSRRLSDRARVWFTLYMSLALLATRVMLYPTQFVYHDELDNYRVLLSIVSTGHLFANNSLLPAAANYPGMEIATTAVYQLTGLSPHSAAVVVLLTARVIMTLALIRVIQRVSKSLTVGCLAALIYATNPQYVFFNSMYAYQSVALPLCFFCIYVFACQPTPRRFVTIMPAVAVVTAIAVTHHLTSVALVVVLLVWYLFTLITRRPVSKLLTFVVITGAVVAARLWLARAVIVPYISEIAHNSIEGIIAFVSGKSSHKLFTDSAGAHTPAWQVIVSIVSVLIILSTLIPALWLAIIKRRLLTASVMVLFMIAAIYPMIPVGHLVASASQVADRSSGFVFVGLGYLIATWWFRDVPFHRHAKQGLFTAPRYTWVLIVGLTICFVGGTVIGSGPDWLHGPGPYMVGGENRSVDRLALQAAYWEAQNLPPDSRVYTDRINGLLAADYGNQHVLTSLADGINTRSMSTLLLAPPMSTDVSFACKADVEFLIADKRLSWSLPHVGFYIDGGEYPYSNRTRPPPSSALTKFDQIQGAERIFDNGAIRIYDLRGLPCAGKS
jgi:hypothetical protein